LREVLDIRRQVACRGFCADVHVWLDVSGASRYAASVSDRQSGRVARRNCSGRGHAERLEDVALDVLRPGLSRDLRDDLTGKGHGKVGILPFGLGCEHRLLTGEDPPQLLATREGQVAPVDPTQLAWQPRR